MARLDMFVAEGLPAKVRSFQLMICPLFPFAAPRLELSVVGILTGLMTVVTNTFPPGHTRAKVRARAYLGVTVNPAILV